MTHGLRHLLPVIRLFLAERSRALLIGALLSATTVMAGIALLGLSGWFITATAIAGLSTATAITFDVFAPAAGIRLLAITRTAARYGERLTTHDATLRVLAALRERLFRGWSAPGAAAMLLHRPAKLLFRLTADIDALDSLYLRVLVPVAAAVCAALVAAITLGLMHPLFGILAALWLLAAGLGIPIVAGKLARKPARRRAHAIEALRSRTIDLVAGQTELMIAGRIAAQQSAIAAADRRLAEADDDLNRIETGVVVGFGLATTVLLTGSLLAVAFLSQMGTIKTPIAALGLLIAFTAVEPFAALRRGAMELGRTVLAARRVAPRLRRPADAKGPQAPAADLAFQLSRVTARPDGAAAPTLHDITLSLRKGEHLALIGASGAGKSTLLALLAEEISPESGTVECVPATLLTQRTELFEDTLRDNLRLADPLADDSKLKHALAASGLLADVEALSRGLDTRLGEGGLGLSGGQARRLSLARLLLRDTHLWLLDEPTEGLDGETARDVLRRLLLAAENRSLVIATHVRREAAIADRIAVIERGRITDIHCRGEAGFDAVLVSLRPD